MKQTRQGLTLVEMLTAVSVIAILIGLLLPAISSVRRLAREAKQRAQFTAIGLALETFKNDFGQYPASNPSPGPVDPSYGGAQKLAEAMMGYDLLGYHPNSVPPLSARDGVSPAHLNLYTNATLYERQGLYLDADRVDAYQVGRDGVDYFGLYYDYFRLAPGAHVLCDTYGRTTVRLSNGENRKVGAPILYYRANQASRSIRDDGSNNYARLIYNFYDNQYLIDIRAQNSQQGLERPLVGGYTNQGISAVQVFYENDPVSSTGSTSLQVGYIQDPTVTARPWPYNPDTYILISAGQDGIYGTDDDIRNFGN